MQVSLPVIEPFSLYLDDGGPLQFPGILITSKLLLYMVVAYELDIPA